MRHVRNSLAFAIVLGFACLARSQTPEVAIFADLAPTWSLNSGQTNLIRWYDVHGKYSVVGMHMVLESGNILKVTQRLEKVDNGGDPDSLDEAYIEARGLWRAGKQYLPFGSQRVLRETVPAVRYDTQLLIESLPIRVAVSDNGEGLTRGVVARVGDWIGFSYAIGDHFAIQGSSLTQFRRPEEAPGRGKGYQRALGGDLSRPMAGGVMEIEWVSLRDGVTATDEDRDLSDVRFSFKAKKTNLPVTVAWSRDWVPDRDWFSVSTELQVSKKLVWEPFVRLERLKWHDFGLTATMRL